MENAAKLFGKRLRAARKATGLTIEKASEKAGLTPNFLGLLERGKKRPSFQAIIDLAKAFNVQPRVLFQFEGDDLDPRVLNRRIAGVLAACTPEQLQQAYRIIRAVFEP
jgi:transcriptional regulator with XRE-family HTH domain